VLAEFDAEAAGVGVAPPYWDAQGTGMTNTGAFLLQDFTKDDPETTYGSYSFGSLEISELLKWRSGEYGIEFRVRPLTDMPNLGNSHHANLLMAWGDEKHSYNASIDRDADDAGPGSHGAIRCGQNDMLDMVTGINWSQPHTIFIGYRGAVDEFDLYLDGKLSKTVAAATIARGHEPAFEGRILFGDTTTGQPAPYSIDLAAEWYFIRLHDTADPAKAEQERTSAQANTSASSADRTGTPLPAFSSLSPAQQIAIRNALAPPPLPQRRNPYSTPMYYQMWGGPSQADVFQRACPDETVRSDLMEALIRDWAEIGMTKLHFYLYPTGSGTAKRDYRIDDHMRTGILEFVRLCDKYGVKIGLRVDPPYSLEDSKNLAEDADPTGNFWAAHPDNPKNEIKEFCGWLTEVVGLMRGKLEYLIIGDEINWEERKDGRGWNQDVYLRFFIPCAAAAHKGDPNVKVSMYAVGSGSWKEVVGLIKAGYTKYGDAVAINHFDYRLLKGFKDDLQKLSPDKKLLLLSNGVGYISSETSNRYPPKDPYPRHNDADQAAMIARTMYTWWDVDADVAPYYVCMRDLIYKGKSSPRWYGFFGFMDLVIDAAERATVQRYPGWHAYQTIAQTFHDREAFKDAAFKVKSTSRSTVYIKAHEQPGKELLVILWGRGGTTNVRIDSNRYGYPVHVNLLNHRQWADVAATQQDGAVTLWDVPVGLAPTIIRLVAP